jgi:hypothetical protein
MRGAAPAANPAAAADPWALTDAPADESRTRTDATAPTIEGPLGAPEAASVEPRRSAVLIELRRIPGAFGGLDFTETVDGQGHVTFKGTANSVYQDLTGDVSQSTVADLLRTVRTNGFFDLDDGDGNEFGPGCRTDAETIQLRITLDGRTKTVRQYLGCPPKPAWLSRFADRIDATVSHSHHIVHHEAPDGGSLP